MLIVHSQRGRSSRNVGLDRSARRFRIEMAKTATGEAATCGAISLLIRPG
jgi:hypothetical protein